MAWQTQKTGSFEKPYTRVRDIPECIKFLLLALLLLLLAAEIGTGEFKRLSEAGWLTWLIIIIKLTLIVGIIGLIRVQRSLKCEITSPKGCTEEEPDPLKGCLFIRVNGTAAGAAFGGYTLEVHKGTITYPGIVTYPGGGTSGSLPVINGELGRINTTSLMDAAYEITLTVHPSGVGSPKTCATTFDLFKAVVYINRVAGVPALSMAPAPGNANPYDAASELRLDVPPSYPLKSVGKSLSIKGAAYLYGCADRSIKKYEIRYAHVTVPGGEPAQPPKDAAVPAAFTGILPPLPLEYPTADYYQPWTRLGIAPVDLINSWKTMTIGTTTYYKLNPTTWNSAAAGSGRYSLLLSAEDTAGHRFFDIQHVWLDNKEITGRIVKFQKQNQRTGAWEDIPTCTDIHLSFGTIRIIGLAWDPLIDEAWWPASAPNDNFGYYNLKFWKQFSGIASPLTGDVGARVPALPATPPVAIPVDADAGLLAQWDLAQLNADASPPTPVDPANKLHRHESCTFILQLFVTDTTVVDEGTTHYVYHQVPVKIVNDL